jgi:uncharacterized protein (DUF736 family)
MSNETEKNEWQQREVGALWKRISKSGQKYLSGHVTVEDELGTEKRMKVICFSNKFKSENEKAPDLRVYLQSDEGAPAAKEEKTADSADSAVTSGDELL